MSYFDLFQRVARRSSTGSRFNLRLSLFCGLINVGVAVKTMAGSKCHTESKSVSRRLWYVID